MSVDLSVARDVDDLDGVSEILREYLTWDIGQLREVSGVDLDVEAYIDNTFKEISLYFPPGAGFFLLERLVGGLALDF